MLALAFVTLSGHPARVGGWEGRGKKEEKEGGREGGREGRKEGRREGIKMHGVYMCVPTNIIFLVHRSSMRDPFCVLKVDNETVARCVCTLTIFSLPF